MTIKELREKRAKAWDDARDFLDSKRNDSGLLSEEDSKTYDDMEQQIVAYGKEIDRLERQEKLAREMNAATSVPRIIWHFCFMISCLMILHLRQLHKRWLF